MHIDKKYDHLITHVGDIIILEHRDCRRVQNAALSLNISQVHLLRSTGELMIPKE